MSIINQLTDAGLTNGEAKVYLALQELGSSTSGPILKKAKVSNSKIYLLLDQLIEKGLVSQTLKDKTKIFHASPPYALVEYVKKKQKELDKTVESIETLLPNIEKLNKKVPQNVARVFSGVSGIKAGLLEAISTIPNNGDYYFFATGYADNENFARMISQVMRVVNERKIKIQGMAHISEKAVFEKIYKKLKYNMRYTKINFPADTTIIGDYIGIIVWEDDLPYLYLIKSSQLVISYTTYFNTIWETALE